MYASLMPDLLSVMAFDPFEVARLAARHHFQGVDLRIEKAAPHLEHDGAKRFRDLLSEHNLRPGYCSVTAGRVSVPQPEWDANLAILPHLCKLARQAGYTRAAVVMLPGHDELPFAENRQLHLSRLRQVAPILADHDLRLGIEYVSPKTRRDGFKHPFVHTMQGALDLLAAVDRPNLGLMLDSFHWHCARETPADLTRLTDAQIVVVHACDAMAGRSIEEQVVYERELPGDSGVIDLNTFFGALGRIGYTGPVTCEPLNPKWEKMDPDEVLRRANGAVGKYV